MADSKHPVEVVHSTEYLPTEGNLHTNVPVLFCGLENTAKFPTLPKCHLNFEVPLYHWSHNTFDLNKIFSEIVMQLCNYVSEANRIPKLFPFIIFNKSLISFYCTTFSIFTGIFTEALNNFTITLHENGLNTIRTLIGNSYSLTFYPRTDRNYRIMIARRS